jgi:hypothetical protein
MLSVRPVKPSLVMTELQWLLPSLGAFIAIIAFFANFSGTVKKFREGDPATLTFILATILLAAYGFERYVNATQLDQRLSGIEKQLSTVVGGQFANNYNDIYRSAAKICGTLEGKLRVIVASAGPKAPVYFAETVAQRLKERKEAGYPISFEAVLVLNTALIADLDALQKAMRDRSALYEKYGVKDIVHVYVIEANPILNFDVLVVDRNHAQIGFSMQKEGKTLESAIMFENQPKIASDFADWFDGFVLPKAKRWEEWLMEERSRRKKPA